MVVVAIRVCPIRVSKKERKEQTRGKGRGKRPRYHDRAISGHNLPHTAAKGGSAVLNKEDLGSDGFRLYRL